MKLVYFTHSLRSCWNHGNAHFLRGVLRDLARRGHRIVAAEAAGAWSAANLIEDHGEAALHAWQHAYPELRATVYRDAAEIALDDADAVIVHEWNPPALVAALGRLRRRGARFRLLFHDTHHRAVSDPEAIRAFDLDSYDGVLAFGEALAAVYRSWGWGSRVFTWHEAADTALFRPPADDTARHGLVWIGNWGDGERSAELETLLLRPARNAALPLDVHGVRYPPEAQRKLAEHGARYRGWLPNAAAPAVFARHLATVHVPRRFYVEALPGIPTIRVFEALASGIPLVSCLWRDTEHLFRPGEDYLAADTEDAVLRALIALREDAALRRHLAASGLAAIRARHSCAHRAEALLGILATIGTPRVTEQAA